DDLAAVKNLHVKLRVVEQFHDVSGRPVENSIDLMAAIGVVRAQARSRLRVYPLCQILFCESSEISVEQAGTIFTQRLFYRLPRKSIVAGHALAGQIFDLPRANVIGIEVNMG